MEDRQRESLHAPGPAARDVVQAAVGEGGASEFGGRRTGEGGRGGGGGGGSCEGRPDTYPRGVVPPSGVV